MMVRVLAINSSGHIFAGTSGGIFRSTNNGDSWMVVNTGLTNMTVRAFAINSSGHIFVGTFGGGVFRSTNNGSSWTPVISGLTNLEVFTLALNSSGLMFVGTNGNGVLRSVASTTSVRETADAMPTAFLLEQNYPNPVGRSPFNPNTFNPNTTIRFILSRSGYVTLKVYNTLGEEVATLAAENLSAGRHQIGWNAGGMAAGVYFYRLQTDGLVQTQKLVVVR